MLALIGDATKRILCTPLLQGAQRPTRSTLACVAVPSLDIELLTPYGLKITQGYKDNGEMMKHIMESLQLPEGGSIHTQFNAHFSSASQQNDLLGLVLHIQKLVLRGVAYKLVGCDPSDSRCVILNPTREDPENAMGCSRFGIQTYGEVYSSHRFICASVQMCRCCRCHRKASFRCKCHCYYYCSEECWELHLTEGIGSQEPHGLTCTVPWFVPDSAMLPEGHYCTRWVPGRGRFEPVPRRAVSDGSHHPGDPLLAIPEDPSVAPEAIAGRGVDAEQTSGDSTPQLLDAVPDEDKAQQARLDAVPVGGQVQQPLPAKKAETSKERRQRRARAKANGRAERAAQESREREERAIQHAKEERERAAQESRGREERAIQQAKEERERATQESGAREERAIQQAKEERERAARESRAMQLEAAVATWEEASEVLTRLGHDPYAAPCCVCSERPARCTLISDPIDRSCGHYLCEECSKCLLAVRPQCPQCNRPFVTFVRTYT